MSVFNDLFAPSIGPTIDVKVSPKSSKNKIKITHNLDGSMDIKIYVTAIAENGKANLEVLKLLSKEIGVPKSKLEIIKGLKSKNKTIKIH